MAKLRFLHFLCCYFAIVYGDKISSDLLPDTQTCGTDAEKRIYGGRIADLDDFPWMALLASEGTDFHCAGTLINNRYVVTAAHCFGRRGNITNVRLGEYDVNTDPDCEESASEYLAEEVCTDDPRDIGVEEVIIHEGFNRKRQSNPNDIALIRLAEAVSFTKYIRPVCLPIEELDKTYAGAKATVAGWGETEKSVSSDKKLKLEVQVKANNNCSLSVGDGLLCAGGELGKDSCTGDSGGPLMFHKDDANQSNWYLIGIVSFGLKRCALENVEGAYSRITNYLPWIVSHLKP